MNHQQKLEQFAEREIKKNLYNIIIDDQNGGHVIFGVYRMQQGKDGVEVYNISNDLVSKFTNKRTALGFCVADKFNQLNLAIQIKNLDNKKQILANDIDCQRNLAKGSKSSNFREMVNTKLVPKLVQYHAVCDELEKCVNSAKYLQLKGFQNETARVFAS